MREKNIVEVLRREAKCSLSSEITDKLEYEDIYSKQSKAVKQFLLENVLKKKKITNSSENIDDQIRLVVINEYIEKIKRILEYL